MAKNKKPRAIAIELGMPTYVTGKPCKNGYVGERRTLSGACCICVAEHLDRMKSLYAEARMNRHGR